MAARPRTPVVVLVLALGAGCAGWHGDTYHAHRLPLDRAREEASYRFGLPGGGWRALKGIKGVQVAWANDDVGGIIQVRAQCDEQGDSSLDQYVDHLRIDWTDWQVLEQEETRLIDRAALRTVVVAELDGVPRKNELWVVKKNGCLFDLMYSADPDRFAQEQPAFARVVEGFTFPVRG